MTDRHESRMIEAVERIASAIEGLLSVAERDEARRSGRGLFELASKYDTDEAERTRLRVVR